MNAVMKEQDIPINENTDLAVIEPKSLAEILVIDESLPTDFFINNDYDKMLDMAIVATENLVYPQDDSGEKQAKSEATCINKYVTQFDKHIAASFKQQTESVSLWRDNKKAKTKKLLENRQRALDQFAEKRQEKLDSITALLTNTLAEYRIEIGLRPEFYGEYDLSPMVKLSGTLTDSGKLTSKALGFVKTIANGKLTLQQRFDSREKDLKIRCLEADINPPLTHVHLGAVMFAEDDIFNAKVEELINAEIERRAEMAARIERQNTEENQKKIAEALKNQQDESNRIAIENASKADVTDASSAVIPIPTTDKKEGITTVGTGNYRQSSNDANNTPASNQENTIPETRTVLVTMVFAWDGVTKNSSNQSVESFLRRKLPEQMQSRLKSMSSENA